MIWAVLDTNTLVSGLGWAGPPSEVIDLAIDGLFTILISRPLVDELADVIQRPKLALHFTDPLSLVLLIEAMAVLVEPTETLDVVKNDPDDNRVLEAAQAGRADYIVSGDSDLCDLGTFEGMPILRPSAFLKLF